MTPTEIQNKRFDKAMSGYRAEDVQAYLLEVASEMQSLMDRNDDLERKLEILAEKVEQYREDEDSLRAALIGAQKLGDSVVRESKRKAETIIAQATRRAEELIAEAQESITKESLALNRIQKEVSKFKRQIISMYHEHLELIDKIPYDESLLEEESAVPERKAEDRFSVSYAEAQRVLDKSTSDGGDAAEDPEGEPEDENQISFETFQDGEEDEIIGVESPDAFPRRKAAALNLGDKEPLRFGPDYELTRDE